MNGDGMKRNGLVFGVLYLLLAMAIAPAMGTNHCQSNSAVEKEGIARLSNNGNTLYVGGSGPNNYTKIQDAIDNASDGDTVFVYDDSSPYYENIFINKSINLIGENSETTVIDGAGNRDVVYIKANDVNISGFTIQNNRNSWPYAGIKANSNCNIIIGNNISNNYYGIYLNSSSNNTVKNNKISSNGQAGIYLHSSSNTNDISNNNILDNENGISFVGQILGPSNNIISLNNISHNGFGIYLESWCNNNTISDNNISDNSGCAIGFVFGPNNNNTISNNTILKNWEGIVISSSNNNTISYNTFSNYNYGILLGYSNNNIISSNKFFKDGLGIIDSYENTVLNNTVNNKKLVYLEEESDKVIDNAGQIILINCDNITIQNQNLSSTYVSIQLCHTNNCLISGNNISNNDCGITLSSSNSNTISDNNISNNKGSGIHLSHTNSNIISDNNIINNLHDGISFEHSDTHNIISGNNITFNHGKGIRFFHSSCNILSTNNISNNDYGVWLEISKSNILSKNIIISNELGSLFLLSSSHNNKIIRNIISGSEYVQNGLRIEESDRNKIYHNTFIGIPIDSYIFYDSFLNIWLRNYWDDWHLPLPRPICGMIIIEGEIHEWRNFDWCPRLKP